MNRTPIPTRQNEWSDYYRKFPYFSAEAVREGCYPRIMERADVADKSVVLVHGLTDSPYFITAIGEYFFNVLGYNVYLPLLQAHGLKEPKGMEDADLDKWKENVAYGVECAKAKSKEVSIGGLSTGGALSFHAGLTNPAVTGTIYLFSAALDLAGGWRGQLLERLARFPGMANLLERIQGQKELIGPNPYRYADIDKDGARELAKLMKDTDALTRHFSAKNPIPRPVFAAHSESDEVASIRGIENILKRAAPNLFTFFRIPKSSGVAHASLVLREPILAQERLLEDKNPHFQEMLDAITRQTKGPAT